MAFPMTPPPAGMPAPDTAPPVRTWAAVVATALFCLLCLFWSVPAIDRPFPGFWTYPDARVVQILPAGWNGTKAGLRSADLIRSADGHPIRSGTELYRYVESRPAGTPVRYGVERPFSPDAGHHELVISTQRFSFAFWSATELTIWLVGVINLTMAWLVFFWAPRDPAGRAFRGLCVTAGLLYVVSGDAHHAYHLFGERTVIALITGINLTTVNLALRFPRPLPHPARLPAQILNAAVGTGMLLAAAFAPDSTLPAVEACGMVLVFLCGLPLIANMVITLVRRSSTEQQLAQARWLLFGYLVSHVPAAVGTGATFAGIAIPGVEYAFVTLGAFPVVVGLAIARYGLFDIDSLLRPSLTYVLVTILLVPLYGMTTALALRWVGQGAVAAFLSALTIALAFAPLRDRIRAWLDRAFFRHTVDVSAVSAAFNDEAQGIFDVADLRRIWLDRLSEALGTEACDFYPPAAAPPAVPHDRCLVMPLTFKGETVGTAVIGPKKSGLAFTQRDRELLDRLGRDFVLWQDHLQRMERDRQQRLQIDALRQTEALQGQFLNLVSHELRSPASAVLHSASFLKRYGADADAAYHDQIYRNMQSLSILVDDLLHADQLTSGRFKLACGPVCLADVLDDVTVALTPLAGAKDMTLQVSSPALPVIWADRHRLDQILRNLVHNAIKYGPAGSRVEIQAAAADGGIRLSVSDQGPGIAAADQAQLFQRFGRLQSSSADREKGVGLGLYIVKALVALHGGQVGVTSDAGRGATFWFILPQTDGKPRP